MLEKFEAVKKKLQNDLQELAKIREQEAESGKRDPAVFKKAIAGLKKNLDKNQKDLNKALDSETKKTLFAFLELENSPRFSFTEKVSVHLD
jgi:ABC-type phosphate transport system auxiliary subunit